MLDFEKEFSEFLTTNQNNAISQIYNIIPTLTQEKISIVLLMKYYINKYELKNLENILNNLIEISKKNKNLNFISSFNVKNLLKAYTQDELIRGIKISSQTGET